MTTLASATTTAPATTTTPAPEPFDPLEATIVEIQQAMDEGRVTSLQLVDFYLERIAAYDAAGPALNSILTLNPQAREEASTLDAERAARGPRGPLHGIPIVVKDNLNTADMPTTGGSRGLADFRTGDDSAQVALLRQAGAIILAKTNLHELARSITTISSLGGQTLNPYAITRNPGGSSGGTAVAVTANFAAAGLGTDTCGSIRIPASSNNLYGLRPTFEWSSPQGVIPLTYTEDTVGPLARTVIDLALLLDVTTAVHPLATVEPFSGALEAVDSDGLVGRRIGVLDNLFSNAHPDVVSATRLALSEIEGAGATIVPVAIPGFDGLRGNAATVFLQEFRFAFDDYLGAYPDAPVSSLAELVALGLHHSAVDQALRNAIAVTTLDTAEHRAALGRRDTVREVITEFMDVNDLDALAYPTIRQPPAPIGQSQEGSNCGTASVGGLPAMVVPAGFTPDGLPVGLELMGRPFDDALLITLAAGYEAATDKRRLPHTTP